MAVYPVKVEAFEKGLSQCSNDFALQYVFCVFTGYVLVETLHFVVLFMFVFF